MQDWDLTTMEEVNNTLKKTYEESPFLKKIKLKAWAVHSSNRIANGNQPFTFQHYIEQMRYSDYVEQVAVGNVDCTDLGGKEKVMSYFMNGE